MQTDVSLIIYDEQTGQAQRVSVGSSRFTIGRLPENDLCLDDTNLSRRHAIIESFDGLVHLSDCGSQNGTYVTASK